MTTTKDKIKKEKKSFSPSINIIRDTDVEIKYIPTPNAKQAFNQLINEYQTGVKSFSIVGAYGIGKSAFLWAFERNINQKKNYFSALSSSFKQIKQFDFLRFVGEYGSFKANFAKHIGVTRRDFDNDDLLQSLDKHYKSISKSGKGLVILVDEFGKYLEYASKNDPENELYFIQQLAEYANDSRKNIFFITTLHQDFNGYSRNLSANQQKEWDKVKGRLKEISFNEPVEQLLYLASERIAELNIGSKDKSFDKLFKSIEKSKAFPLRDYFNENIAEKLLPFDIISAAVLTLSFQKYGQNERSLFSFIESNDHLGIRDFNDQKSPYYNLASVYDYLIQNYYSFLTTKYNPHYAQWAAIRTAIERAEGFEMDKMEDAIKIIKTIGLLNIFASASARLNKDFLCDYGKYSLGLTNTEKTLDQLSGLRIIRFIKHSSKYILFEGTDLDIELAIDEAGNLVEKVTNVVHHLNKHFSFPYISAKAAYYDKGTPRFFAFHITEVLEGFPPEGEVDGFINLVFSDDLKEKDIKDFSEECDEAILFGWFKNTEEIRNLLFEISKIEKVKENNAHDRIAVRELEGILQHQIKLLNHYIIGNMYAEDSNVSWFFKGKKEKIQDQKSFNRVLSKICNDVYSGTPVFKNEMVNKTRLSGALATAKKNFVTNLTENWSESDLGFESIKFPPEKTVYLSLLQKTGIHRKQKDGYTLGNPIDETFTELWKECIDFIQDSKLGKRNLQELADKLMSRPYKLKKGFVDFWLPVFLFANRDEFALFSKESYIPFLTDETLDLVSRDPSDFEIKAFDIGGVKLNIFNRYRALLNQSENKKPTASTFIETIRPFLVFYKELPLYAKNTKNLDKKTLALRDAIAYSKDPEETFFENFPKALGFNLVQLQNDKKQLEAYAIQLQESIKKIRTSYDSLIDDFELYLQEEIVGVGTTFTEYKSILQNRFKKIKKHLLLPHQKVLMQRINSELDDRKAWLSSIAHACVGKSLDSISDEEKGILFERLNDTIYELDNLCEISKSGFDESKEIAIKLEVTSFVKGLQKSLVRIPKSKDKELRNLEENIKAKLTKDKHLNIATLAKLLEELIRNEK